MESLLPLLTRSINFIGDGGREAECILSEADRQRAAPQPHLQAETAGSDQRLERPHRHRPRRRRCARRRVAGRPVWSQRVPAVPIQAHRFWLHGSCREALRRDSWRLAEHKTPANTWWTASGSNRRPPPCKGPRASPNESRRTPGIWVAEWLQTDRHATIGQHSCSRPACTLRSSQSDSVTPRSASRWTF